MAVAHVGNEPEVLRWNWIDSLAELNVLQLAGKRSDLAMPRLKGRGPIPKGISGPVRGIGCGHLKEAVAALAPCGQYSLILLFLHCDPFPFLCHWIVMQGI